MTKISLNPKNKNVSNVFYIFIFSVEYQIIVNFCKYFKKLALQKTSHQLFKPLKNYFGLIDKTQTLTTEKPYTSEQICCDKTYLF